MFQNSRKAQRWWGMISKLFKKPRETVQDHGMMYKLVAQTVLIYVSKSWVVTGAMLKILEGFHH